MICRYRKNEKKKFQRRWEETEKDEKRKLNYWEMGEKRRIKKKEEKEVCIDECSIWELEKMDWKMLLGTMNCVEIYTDPSNGQNSLEPKPLELGLAQFVSNVIHIRNKYDCSF